MAKREIILGAALAALLLASCGGRDEAITENNSVEAGTNELDNAGESDPAQPNVSEDPAVDTVPPPDAVSHPDGYLPNAGDPPAPSEPEPSGANPARPQIPPPATEDQYTRNKQAGA